MARKYPPGFIITAQALEIESTRQPGPFIKWVGGKRSILDKLIARMPSQINNYYEPFVGGGALFFNVYHKVGASYISDLNVDLVVAYLAIRDNVRQLISELKIHEKNHSREYYYQIRAQHELRNPVANSARFIYLMKTCYNGLYRVNKHNEFNVAMGSYVNPIVCDEENLLNVAESLANASIRYQDFTNITPRKGDFVYFDPPYHGGFTRYVVGGFTQADQIRLRDFALELTKQGVNVMLSNSDHEFISGIYNDFNIERITNSRLVSCNGGSRGPVGEFLITNY